MMPTSPTNSEGVNLGSIARNIQKEMESIPLRVVSEAVGDYFVIKGFKAPTGPIAHFFNRLISSRPVLEYVIGSNGVKGPDPCHDDGKSSVGAAIGNIAEDLFVEDLRYSPESGMYARS